MHMPLLLCLLKFSEFMCHIDGNVISCIGVDVFAAVIDVELLPLTDR